MIVATKQKRNDRLSIMFVTPTIMLVALTPLHVSAAADPAQDRSGVDTGTPVETRPFQIILPSAHLLGDWNGLRTGLEDAGITPALTLLTQFAANPTGGKSQGATQETNLGLSLQFDLDRMCGIAGGSFLVQLSQRFGSNLSSDYVGNVFSIQSVGGENTFHVVDVAYRQQLFGDRVDLRVGRIATADDFLISAYDYLFMQNGFDGNPHGIFFNAPGMTVYPKATWGAVLRLKPTVRSYVMVGLYNGDPSIRDNEYHGVNLSLDGPLFAIGEIGYQFNGLPGDTGLFGNYKAGAWYDDSTFTDFQSKQLVQGSWGVYGLFDQVVVPFGPPDSNRGLAIFGSVMFGADPAVQQMPFFFTAGVAERGIFESRPKDWCGLGIVYGQFSNELRESQIDEQQLNPNVVVQDHEMAIELFYRFYLDKHAVFVQPDFQYIVHPGGTGTVDNAVVLGCQIGINF
jgi:porin